MEKRNILSKITVATYLRHEAKSQFRHEFVNGQVFAMTGGTFEHGVICGNIHAIIHAHLKGSTCRVFMNNMQVHASKLAAYYYPDVSVTCENLEPRTNLIKCPKLIIEVLSKSTRSTDRREKLVAYTSISSLSEYLMIDQYRHQVTLVRRLTKNNWEKSIYRHNDVISLNSIALHNIEANDFYASLEMPTSVQEADFEEEEEYVGSEPLSPLVYGS